MVVNMNFKAIFRGLILALVVAMMSLLIGAVLVYFNVISEKAASIVFFVMIMLGIFLGAFGVVKASESKILVNALSLALIFSVIIIVVSLIVNNGFVMHTRTLTLIGGAFATSFLGALFGK